MATQMVSAERANASAERARFDRDGFSIFRNVLDTALIDRLREASDASLAEQDAQHFAEQVATGSMILVNGPFIERYPVFAELIAHPGVMQALARLGFRDPKFGHGRVICKPPHSPPLFWHEDGRFWDDPVSYTPVPIQAFLMFYLTDTTPENGCLRVIPGSHLKRHPLHDLVPESHTHDNRQYHNPDGNPAFARYDDEVDVALRAGDFVAGYGTVFHAAHGNTSDRRRTCLTLWYYPAFPDLPERTQASVAAVEHGLKLSANAPPELAALLRPLDIVYEGNAEPIPTNWVSRLR